MRRDALARLAPIPLLIIAAAHLPAVAGGGGEFPLFNAIVIDQGEVVDEDVVSVGGKVIVRGEVHADVVVVGGEFELSGRVSGDVVNVLSDTRLGRGATIDGDFVCVLSDFEDAGAQITGERVYVPMAVSWLPRGIGPFKVLASVFAGWQALRAVLVLLLVVLFALLLPARIEAIARATPANYGVALLLGFVLHLLALAVVLALFSTVIAIPLAVLVQIAFWVLRTIGRAGLFCAMGQGLLPGGQRSSVLAAVLVGFIPYAVLTVTPFFFGLPGLVFGLLLVVLVHVVIDWPALGLLAMTRFGEPNRPQAAVPAAPPEPGTPPPVG